MRKIEETIIIRNNKLIYAVRLAGKVEGTGSRIENNNPYILAENGEVKFIDNLYGNKCEFNFSDNVHVVAKEIFVSGLRTAIKTRVLELKQIELVLNEMGLADCIGDTVKQGITFLEKVKQYVVGA